MIKVEDFEINKNFWEVYPNFLVNRIFKKLYEEDTTEKKWKSSKQMWGIALVFDYESFLFNKDEQTRKTEVTDNYLGQECFHGDRSIFRTTTFKPVIDEYIALQQTPERILLNSIDKKILSINKLIDNIEIQEDNSDKVIKLLENGLKLVRIRQEQMEKVEIEDRIRGNVSLTIAEKRERNKKKNNK